MTGRVTGPTVVNGVPAKNILFESRDRVFDVKVLDPYDNFHQNDVIRVERNGR